MFFVTLKGSSETKTQHRSQSATAPDGYLGVRYDAVDFENLLVGIGLGDVELPDHSSPVALTAAAADVRATC